MKKYILLIQFLMINNFLNAQTVPTNPIPFSGGVDYSKFCTEVSPNDACDASNLLAGKNGSASPRNGSERFNLQSYSTNPITSLFRYFISSGTLGKSGLIAITDTSILQSTNSLTDNSKTWVALTTTLATPNQKFSFVQADPDILMTGDALTDPVYRFNVLTSSLSTLFSAESSSDSANIRSKYVSISRNFALFANVRDIKNLSIGTTDYPSRIYYSRLLQFSSVTTSRFEDVGIENGEITGISSKLGKVEIYQPKNVTEMAFTNLNVGGNQDLTPIVDGFGLIAPQTLAKSGIYDMGLSYDGIFVWDGSRRTRLDVSQERDLISKDIRPKIEDLVKSGKYKNAVGKFYDKRNLYIFCYEDISKFPKNFNNTCLAFDFNLGKWYPINNWIPQSLEVFNKPNDKGDLVFGDNDGYVHIADVQTRKDDSPKEISIDSMESTKTWIGSSTSTVTALEGYQGVRLQLHSQLLSSSITKLAVFDLNSWYDKSSINKDDLFQFKVYPSSLSRISDVRIDLLVEDKENAFSTNFSSVVISSNALTSGNTAWSTISIAFSSFPTNSDWINLSSETIQFMDRRSFFGIRFVATATAESSLTFDDLRVVQKTDNFLNPFWLTPSFNLGNISNKEYRELKLVRSKPSDSEIKIDVLTDFGKIVKTITSPQDIPKTIFLLGMNGIGGIYELNSIDFSLIRSTIINNPNDRDYTFGTSDRKKLYLGDQAFSQIISVKRESFTVIVDTYGSLGSGTSNYDQIHQMSLDFNSIYSVDNQNHRIKQNNVDGLKLKNVYGELGLGATNYHDPTGICIDELNFWVVDHDNASIKKYLRDGYKFVESIPIGINSIGESSIVCDNENLYVAYNRISEFNLLFDDVILEKRLKSNGILLNRKIVRPKGTTELTLSTFSLTGDLNLQGDHIFVPFTEDSATLSNKYYVQKLLKDDFSLVKELVMTGQNFGLISNGLEFLPSEKTESFPLKIDDSIYIQFRFYSDKPENSFKLINHSITAIQKPYTEEK